MRFFSRAAFLFLTAAFTLRAENLLENGSFEQPISPEAGGLAALVVDSQEDGGKVEAGITSELARTGKQSLYVAFDKATIPGRKAVLKTGFVPVKAGQAYRLSIWGRIDRNDPLALDERRPQLWLEIRFFQEDQKTEVGEPVAGAEYIPGDIIPGGLHSLRFVTHRWSESSAEVPAPPAAAFVQVSWYWMSSQDEGATTGKMYWDDAAIEPAAPPASEPTPPPGAPAAGAAAAAGE